MPEETESLQAEDAQTQAVVEAPAGPLPPPEERGPDAQPDSEVVYCPQCGARMVESDRFCGSCGWDAERPDETPNSANARREPPPTPRRTAPPSNRNRLTTFLLCLLLGYFGVHRFYVGKIGTGLVWLFTGGILAVGWIYDLVMIATGEFLDEDGRRIVYWQ
jgi:TM2 domain-containing membrane protein YozV